MSTQEQIHKSSITDENSTLESDKHAQTSGIYTIEREQQRHKS